MLATDIKMQSKDLISMIQDSISIAIGVENADIYY